MSHIDHIRMVVAHKLNTGVTGLTGTSHLRLAKKCLGKRLRHHLLTDSILTAQHVAMRNLS